LRRQLLDLSNSSTIDWYDANAATFVERTFAAGMDAERARFLSHVPTGGAVLDAGCGSGRDALAFREAGYEVSAFDGSVELARIARANIGVAVRHLSFAEMDWEAAFDGVWACATLLHLPLADLPAALANIRCALKPGGVFYCSFKEGDGERIVGGRHFTDMTLQTLRTLLAAAGFEILTADVSFDNRADHAGERWVSAVARRPMAEQPSVS
jgi:SAM-dependent methyltransferase